MGRVKAGLVLESVTPNVSWALPHLGPNRASGGGEAVGPGEVVPPGVLPDGTHPPLGEPLTAPAASEVSIPQSAGEYGMPPWSPRGEGPLQEGRHGADR